MWNFFQLNINYYAQQMKRINKLEISDINLDKFTLQQKRDLDILIVWTISEVIQLTAYSNRKDSLL